MSAAAEFQRRYRAEHPDTVERNVTLARARRRALLQLADLHPAQYVVLLDAECARVGIDPPGSKPTGRPSGGAR